MWAEAWEVTAGSPRLPLHGAEGVHHDPDNLPLFRSASAVAAGAIAERYSGVASIKAPLRVLDRGGLGAGPAGGRGRPRPLRVAPPPPSPRGGGIFPRGGTVTGNTGGEYPPRLSVTEVILFSFGRLP